MKIRSMVLAAIALAIMFMAPSFLVRLSTSDFTQCDPYEYTPWADGNDDGKIDIFDVVYVASKYSMNGCATKTLNITNWPDWFNTPQTEVGDYAQASMCTILDMSSSAYALYDIRWTGKDTNSSSVSGIGNETVRFYEGSLSGGGVLWAQDVETRPFYLTHIPASGYIEVRDFNGATLAVLALPFTVPIQIDDVASFEVTVVVPYSCGVFYGPISKEVFAIAGVSYEVLN